MGQYGNIDGIRTLTNDSIAIANIMLASTKKPKDTKPKPKK